MRNKLGILLFLAILFSVIPFPASGASWEDRLDEAHQAGYEVGYEQGYGDGYIAGEIVAEKQSEEYYEYVSSAESVSEDKGVKIDAKETRIEDIGELIRQAQAEAIVMNGGITATDFSKVEADTKRILREKYGVGVDSVSSFSDGCQMDHEVIAEAARNKGRVEAAVVCAALFTLYVVLLRRK